MNRDSTTPVSLGLRSEPATMDPGPTSHAQWGAIAAGSLAGFGVTIIMATLGAAIGATTGAIVASESGAADPKDVAMGAGIGLAAWTLLSALVVGFVGGAVLNRMARYDRPYMPTAFGVLTWAGGVALALLVGASPASGLMAGAGDAAGAAFERKDVPADRDRALPRAERPDPREAGVRQDREPIQEAAK